MVTIVQELMSVMIFAIYRGKDEAEVQGRFTKGRLYVACPEVENSAAVGYDKIIVKDDDGKEVWVEEMDLFRYPQEVFAVMLKKLGGKVAGEVVVVDGVDGDGFLSVKGMGFVCPKNVQLMDSTLVRPGMMAYDRESKRWNRVERVDERMRVRTESSNEMRECGDFIFPISDGELATVPFLRCVDATGLDNLREGSVYRVSGIDDMGLLIVDGVPLVPERFEII